MPTAANDCENNAWALSVGKHDMAGCLEALGELDATIGTAQRFRQSGIATFKRSGRRSSRRAQTGRWQLHLAVVSAVKIARSVQHII
jgi:hypothetical protein